MRVITRSRGRRIHPQHPPEKAVVSQPGFDVVPPQAPPAPPQVPVFGVRFRPTMASDVLVEAFSSVGTGNYCMFCCTKKPSHDDMILCQCGDFMCTNCFLNGLNCSNSTDLPSSCSPHISMPDGKGNSSNREVTPANFVTSVVVTQLMNQQFGQRFRTLEVRFETLLGNPN